eukprot:TRINITY_DN5232_c1_g1_i2.p1 TRINITY_DN5232_c1_g1~~TRINITY_DN5232_c1_g1_i2.p1  ORF type:complete len:188 (-),score=58.43 TRINITY_DN5232_c1_g1_i2:50-613(-)
MDLYHQYVVISEENKKLEDELRSVASELERTKSLQSDEKEEENGLNSLQKDIAELNIELLVAIGNEVNQMMVTTTNHSLKDFEGEIRILAQKERQKLDGTVEQYESDYQKRTLIFEVKKKELDTHLDGIQRMIQVRDETLSFGGGDCNDEIYEMNEKIRRKIRMIRELEIIPELRGYRDHVIDFIKI